MACWALDITLVRAEGLYNVNYFTSMAVYAVVSISGDPRTRQYTSPDFMGHCNPQWDQSFRFAIPACDPENLALHVLLRSYSYVFSHTDVGEVYIPLRTLLSSIAAKAIIIGCPVQSICSNRAQGVLYLSCKIGGH